MGGNGRGRPLMRGLFLPCQRQSHKWHVARPCAAMRRLCVLEAVAANRVESGRPTAIKIIINHLMLFTLEKIDNYEIKTRLHHRYYMNTFHM